jgi:hypothetical protein
MPTERYQLLINHGTDQEKIGSYHGTPDKVATRICRSLVQSGNKPVNKPFKIQFVKNRVLSMGGDLLYVYEVIARPHVGKPSNNEYENLKKYDIFVKQLE